MKILSIAFLFCITSVFAQRIPIREWDWDVSAISAKSLEEAFKVPDKTDNIYLKSCTYSEFQKLTGLKNLKVICIDNYSSDSLPPEIKTLTKLQLLKIEYSPLRYFPDEVSYLKDLRSIRLFRCPLKELNPLLFELPKLCVIHIDSTDITEISPNIAKSKLQLFALFNSKLDKFPAGLCEVKTLQALSLNSNKIKELPDCVTSLVNLEYFTMNRNQLSDFPTQLLNLPRLELLGLSDNKIPEEKQVEPTNTNLTVMY